MPQLPYTIDQYRRDLERMMTVPTLGQPQVQQTGNPMMDGLRNAAMNMRRSLTTPSGTALAGTAY